jgi:3-ketoacyl-CoA synthase
MAKLPQLPTKSYKPDFSKAAEHFCIHAGGKAVIDGVAKALNLSTSQQAASIAALRTYGNTSSASVWYELEYIVDHMDVRKGDKVLQLAFGSGFKANTAVWRCLRTPQRYGTFVLPEDSEDEN